MKILIGYDGSASADKAIEDLKRAGLPREAEVLVVSVADLLMSNPPLTEVVGQAFTSRRVAAGIRQAQTHGENVRKEAKALSAQAKMRVQTHFPEWKVENKFIAGSPASELIELAKSWNADLVVIGSQGRGAIGRFLLGSVSKKLATDAHCSVRVARPGNRKDDDFSPPRIIIGVDDSPGSVEAIYSVGQRIWQEGTEVRLIYVDDGTTPKRLTYKLPEKIERLKIYQNKESRLHSILEWSKDELNEIGMKASFEMRSGKVEPVLIEEARKWNADSIFIGTRSLGSYFERFRLSSVSTAVVTNAHCSVEIVRRTEKIKD